MPAIRWRACCAFPGRCGRSYCRNSIVEISPGCRSIVRRNMRHKTTSVITRLAGHAALQAEIEPPTQFAVVANGSATSRPIKLMGIDSVLSLYSSLDGALSGIAGE